MQVRESPSLGATDCPQLLGLATEDSTKAGEVDRLDAVAVAPHHRRRHGQRVEDGLFRGFDCRRDHWVQMRVGEVYLLKRRLSRIMRDHVCGGEGQHEIAAAVARGGACARQPQRGTFCQSCRSPARVDRGRRRCIAPDRPLPPQEPTHRAPARTRESSVLLKTRSASSHIFHQRRTLTVISIPKANPARATCWFSLSPRTSTFCLI